LGQLPRPIGAEEAEGRTSDGARLGQRPEGYGRRRHRQRISVPPDFADCGLKLAAGLFVGSRNPGGVWLMERELATTQSLLNLAAQSVGVETSAGCSLYVGSRVQWANPTIQMGWLARYQRISALNVFGGFLPLDYTLVELRCALRERDGAPKVEPATVSLALVAPVAPARPSIKTDDEPPADSPPVFIDQATFCGTYLSTDGQYFRSLTVWDRLRSAYDTLGDELDRVEAPLVRMLRDGTLRTWLVTRPESHDAAAECDRARYPIVALVAALSYWFLVRDGAEPTNGDPAFYALLRGIVGQMTEEERAGFMGLGDDLARWPFSLDYAEGIHPSAGVKLTPLTRLELARPGDPGLVAWREVAAAQLASDLMINLVAPQFPAALGWTLLGPVGPGFYRNEPVRRLFGRAARAAGPAAELARARRDSAALAPAAAGEPDRWRERELAARAGSAAEFARGFLAMTDAALAQQTEHAGLTLGQLPRHMRRTHRIDPQEVRPLLGAFADRDAWARLLFELAYGLAALHTRAGLAHGDPHPDNVTLYAATTRPVLDLGQPGDGRGGGERMDDAPYVAAYLLGHRPRDVFLFPYDGFGACFIDFSRAILGPAAARRAAELARAAGAPAPLAPAAAAEAVLRAQEPRLVEAVVAAAPGLEPDRAALLAAAGRDRDGAFAVACHADCARLFGDLAALVAAAGAAEPGDGAPGAAEPGDARRFEVSPAFAAACRRFADRAGSSLAAAAADLLAGRTPAVPAWPLEEARRECAAYRADAWSPSMLRAALVSTAAWIGAPLRWTLARYEDQPPWTGTEKIVAHVDAFLARAGLPPSGMDPHAPAPGVTTERARRARDVAPGAARAAADEAARLAAEDAGAGPGPPPPARAPPGLDPVLADARGPGPAGGAPPPAAAAPPPAAAAPPPAAAAPQLPTPAAGLDPKQELDRMRHEDAERARELAAALQLPADRP
jgi:hypothetical protein